jgi:hypothetical protein
MRIIEIIWIETAYVMLIKKYVNLRVFLFVILCTCNVANCLAEQIEKDGVVTISGAIDMQGYGDFFTMIKNKKITRVIFRECFGGAALAGLNYAKIIRRERITTVAQLTVASACAYAFLGGSVRIADTFGEGSVLMLHGMRNEITQDPGGPRKNQQFLDFLYEDIGLKFVDPTKKIILNTQREYEGIYFISRSSLGERFERAMYCDGLGAFDFNKCHALEGINLKSQGIVTE